MAFRLAGAKPLSESMLDYCKLDLKNKFQWNSNRNSNIVIQENVFESVVCEMTSILSRSQWVNCISAQNLDGSQQCKKYVKSGCFEN